MSFFGRKLGRRRLSARLSQWGRDLAMVGESFAGTPRIFVDRPPPPAVPLAIDSSPSPRSTRPVEVVLLRRETVDAVTIGLNEGVFATRPLPGQFLTLDVMIDGQRHRRSYSLTSLPDDPMPTITVKRIDGGRVSTHLTRALRLGDRIDVSEPSGSFTLASSPHPARRLLLVAGGSGITSLWTLLRHALVTEPSTRVHLLYGNRRSGDVIFKSALDAFAAEHPRLTLDYVLEDAPADWKGSRGALDATILNQRLAAVPFDLTGTEAFLCGPEPMRRAARETLALRGLSVVREEVYVRPRRSRRLRETVRVRDANGEHAIVVQGHESILEAAQRQGIALSFSCAMGGCGACRMRLTQGTLEMDEPNCLTAVERGAGIVLTCIGHPTTPCTLEPLTRTSPSHSSLRS